METATAWEQLKCQRCDVSLLNGARIALKLSGIQAVKGGCVVAGRAEVAEGLPLLQLDAKLRENLQTLSMANQLVANAGQTYAKEIAEDINNLKEFLAKARAFLSNYKGGKQQAALAKAYALYAQQTQATLLASPSLSNADKQQLKTVTDAAQAAWDFYQSGQPCQVATNGGGGNHVRLLPVADCQAFAATIQQQLSTFETVSQQAVVPVIAPAAAWALKKMAQMGAGALLDGLMQYSLYKYASGLGWKDAWSKMDFNESSMFFSGLASMVDNKAISVGIDATSSLMNYILTTPADKVSMPQVMVELAKGGGMGLVANYGGRGIAAVSQKLGGDKTVEGLIRLCKDLRISREASQTISKLLDGVVDKRKFDEIWKRVYGKAVQGAERLNFSSLIKANLSKLGVSDDIAKYALAPSSKGGAYILHGVSVEAKEIALADEIFSVTNQRSIFPQNNLQAIEGFLEDGTPFTMKELESNFNSFATRINEMSSKIKTDPNFQWIGSEGYLKIPFSNFTKIDGTIQAVTKQYVEQQFNASIGRNAFTIKNDGTIKNITIFLQDGSNFRLDLTKLKP